ncbi:MAG TPA: hypothetical protein VEZ71_05240, partial [Archangium sp.]|nr:hypothetical protein [Archangium sp.]
ARLTDDLDDIDQTIPGPGNPAPGTGPAPRGAASAPATPSPAPAVGAASTASRPEQPVVLSVLAGGRQGNTRD